MKTELDLREIFFILKRRLWLILAVTMVAGAASFAYTNFCITPLYSATASMYVYNEKSRTEDITTSDLTTSQKLVETYVVILTSNSVLKEVSSKLGGTYSHDQIRKMTTASPINNTEAFRITVTHENPAVAQRIANTIATVAPAEIIRVVKAGSVEVIDFAELPQSPSSPNIMRNTAMGAMVAFMLSVVGVMLIAMFDTVVKSEEQLVETFNIPVLGVIPNMAENRSEEESHG